MTITHYHSTTSILFLNHHLITWHWLNRHTKAPYVNSERTWHFFLFHIFFSSESRFQGSPNPWNNQLGKFEPPWIVNVTLPPLLLFLVFLLFCFNIIVMFLCLYFIVSWLLSRFNCIHSTSLFLVRNFICSVSSFLCRNSYIWIICLFLNLTFTSVLNW